MKIVANKVWSILPIVCIFFSFLPFFWDGDGSKQKLNDLKFQLDKRGHIVRVIRGGEFAIKYVCDTTTLNEYAAIFFLTAEMQSTRKSCEN